MKGPGLIILIPVVQQLVKVDLRVMVQVVPPQDAISRDNVSVQVNAVLYFRIVDPERSIITITVDPFKAFHAFASTCCGRPDAQRSYPPARGQGSPGSSRMPSLVTTMRLALGTAADELAERSSTSGTEAKMAQSMAHAVIARAITPSCANVAERQLG